MVALALADMGNNIAAARGSLLLQHVPEIEAILMVDGGLSNLGKVHKDRGEPATALPLIDILHALVRLHGRNGGWETARRLAAKSLELAKRADQPLLIAKSMSPDCASSSRTRRFARKIAAR